MAGSLCSSACSASQAVLAVRRVTSAASALLVPHQYGIGVASGAERILHSMQHTLTDKQRWLAALKCDITNAFNCCNRALLLEKLYGTPELSALYSIAAFAYSMPSTLLLERADGDFIESRNGVRQGDPLSALLFCLYMRDVYAAVANAANVTLYAFVDDLHVVGEPAEVLKALTALETALPAVSLTCNTSKSQFAYFHNEQAPLMRATLETLADRNIIVRTDERLASRHTGNHSARAAHGSRGRSGGPRRASSSTWACSGPAPGGQRRVLPPPAARRNAGAERHAAAASVHGTSAQLPAAVHATQLHCGHLRRVRRADAGGCRRQA